MPPITRVHWTDTCRLVPSLYPAAGVLDTVASPADLPFIFELESWTNDGFPQRWESSTGYQPKNG